MENFRIYAEREWEEYCRTKHITHIDDTLKESLKQIFVDAFKMGSNQSPLYLEILRLNNVIKSIAN